MIAMTPELFQHVYGTPFQYKLFAAATVLNLVMNLSGLVTCVIQCLLKMFAREAVIVMHKPDDGAENYHEAVNKAVSEEVRALDARRPFGRTMGLIECQAYLYALIAGMESLLGGILVFKAFSSWLDAKRYDTASNTEMHMLARYYGYAIGNFVSILTACAIFEILRFLAYTYPGVREWLIVMPGA